MSRAAWMFLDKDYYSTQAGRNFLSKRRAFRHYQRLGQGLGLDPHRYFCTDWYRWQNPHWQESHADPFSQFIRLGSITGADPSYLVDMVTYLRRVTTEEPLATLFRDGGSITDGVYPNLAVLDELRTGFLASIAPVALRVRPPARRRRYLVHLQAGSAASGKPICESADRTYDVLMNYYRSGDLDPDVGEYALFQIGTKFTAAFLIFSRFAEIYRHYRYVLFLDDDIEADPGELDDLFRLCEQEGLNLGQASLTSDSHCVWPVLFSKGSSGLRYINAVEIMMPVLSAEALHICGPHFADSISGFGLDLLFGKLVGARRDRATAVVDGVALRHRKPIEEATGAFYEFMRANRINPKAELWRLKQTHGLEPEIRESP